MKPTHVSESFPAALAKYQIKPIPTTFDGITFRSRTEARWAVFFNELGLQYEYEKEGFDLDGVWYLPDFWLPALGQWFEVKGEDVDEDAADKASRLAIASDRRVVVSFGGHQMPNGPHGPTNCCVFFPDGGADSGYWWCQCEDCGSFGIEFEGRTDRLPCKRCYQCSYHETHMNFDSSHVWFEEIKKSGKCPSQRCGPCPRHGGNYDRGHNEATDALCEAFSAARSARFGR